MVDTERQAGFPWYAVPALVVAGLGTIVFAFAPGESSTTWAHLSDVGFLFAAPLTTFALLRGTSRLHADKRREWQMLTLTLGVMSIGDVIWSTNGLRGTDPSYPGPADIAYSAGYLLLFVTALRLPARRSLPAERAKWLLDASIATLSVGLLTWHTYLGETFVAAISTGPALTRVVSGAYPVFDLLKITALVLLMVRPTTYVLDRRIAVLGTGIVALIVANAIYFDQVARDEYWSGNWVSSLWFLFYGLVATVAALIDRPGPLAVNQRRERWWAVVPVYLAVGAMLVHEVTDTVGGHFDAALNVGSAAVVLLIVIRQTVANRESKQLLEKHRNDLVASVSHELRTPLAAIHGFTELLIDRELSPDEHDEVLGMVHEQTTYLNRIVSDLVASARGSLQDEKLKIRSVGISDVIDPAVKAARLEHRTEIEMSHGLVALADEERARQVVVNLLTNAGRYGHERILISARQVDSRILVEIHDDGPGVPRRYQDLIWEQFERGAHRLDARIPGSGLGLSISRGLAIAQGGSVTYRTSDRLGGACFTLSLPAASVSLPQAVRGSV